ncbi:hypothetical protein GTNG_3073 [Geobacillus thermodenitrificans NG80-2]|jgi:hypothetical protein|uniref:Uncharacterized protein n=1 Tax=Geobacillus thermodenitrificans (strain NG80-2) TaxID=420246 RepID=A4ISW4_GEOTN|nr:hypothetical protein GTNG_3073 [Geobacillus thermodenitrificans NG80-2]
MNGYSSASQIENPPPQLLFSSNDRSFPILEKRRKSLCLSSTMAERSSDQGVLIGKCFLCCILDEILFRGLVKNLHVPIEQRFGRKQRLKFVAVFHSRNFLILINHCSSRILTKTACLFQISGTQIRRKPCVMLFHFKQPPYRHRDL